jgi:hypothetical protein
LNLVDLYCDLLRLQNLFDSFEELFILMERKWGLFRISVWKPWDFLRPWTNTENFLSGSIKSAKKSPNVKAFPQLSLHTM